METLTDTYKAYKEATQAVWDAYSQRDPETGNRLPVPPEVGAAFDKAMADHQRAFTIAMLRANVGDRVQGLDYEMVLVRKSGTEGFVLSSDGGDVIREWHRDEDGPGNSDVFYEVYDVLSSSRIAHGYLDACSRRIVQLG